MFTTAGESFAAAFARADDAVAVAVDAQASLGVEPWPPEALVRVRMGVPTGEAQERDGDYFGPALNLAARIMGADHGGQVLVSATTAQVSGRPDLVDLGEVRPRGLPESHQLFQVGDAIFDELQVERISRGRSRTRHGLTGCHSRSKPVAKEEPQPVGRRLTTTRKWRDRMEKSMQCKAP